MTANWIHRRAAARDVLPHVTPLTTEPVSTRHILGKLKALPLAPKRPSPSALYGVACVAAERMRRSQQSDVDLADVWENLLGSLKAPSSWELSEPMFAVIKRSAAGRQLRAILARGQCGLPLASIAPIGSAGARHLARAGVFTFEALLRRGRTPAGRTTLAKATGCDVSDLEAWARLAELAVVLAAAGPDLDATSVGDLVTLAALIGIDDVTTMASADPNGVAPLVGNLADQELQLAAEVRRALRDIFFSWTEASARFALGNGSSGVVQNAPPTNSPA